MTNVLEYLESSAKSVPNKIAVTDGTPSVQLYSDAGLCAAHWFCVGYQNFNWFSGSRDDGKKCGCPLCFFGNCKRRWILSFSEC